MGLQAPQRRASWHDAADTALDLYEWMSRSGGREYLAWHFAETSSGLLPETSEMVKHLYENEAAKLYGPDPIFVSTEMCELVEHAAEGFQPEPLFPADFLTIHAFMLFEKPFVVPSRFDRPVTIAAASWTPMLTPKTVDALAGVDTSDFLRWFQDRDYGRFNGADASNEEGSGTDGVALTLYEINESGTERLQRAPAVIPMHLTPWFFGMSFEGNDIDENGVATGAAWWWRVMQTTLRLMQQRIAQPMHLRPDRSSRRRAARLGLPDDRDTVVVRLRREKGDPTHGDERSANYSHRFMVNGHWRNQPYRSEGPNVYRQIWISPYVKGPEDAPLIWRPNRVYNWGR